MSDSLFGFTSSFVVPTVVSIAIGTTPITSGTVGRVLFEGTGNVVSESANLFFDVANGRFGVGTSTPSAIIHSVGSVTASGLIARANFFNNTLVASANNDVLVGLDITPTFTNGAFTGVSNYLINMSSPSVSGASIFVSKYAFGNSWILNLKDGGTTQTGNIMQGYGLELGSSNSGLGGILKGKWGVGYSAGTVSIPVTLSINGSLGVGITADAGFKADINGTLRVSGQVDISPGLTTMQISSVQQINSRLIQFNTNGASGGWSAGYEFRSGFSNSYGTTTAFRIWSNSATTNRVGVGNLTESDMQGGSSQLYINNQTTGGRNAGVRITPAASSTTEFNGIQFDYNNKDSNGGVFIGSQSNPLTNGYDMDLVVLTTGTNPGSYSQTARFMGKYNSFYVGTDKTLAVASAKMQVESTTQGFLPPRMTTTQKNAIASPTAGLVVFDSTLNKLCVYTTTWETVTSI